MSESSTPDVVTVERRIAAPPEAIFELLVYPERHQEIDGSGSVRDARAGSGQRLALGSRFGMSMKIGVPYAMSSKVVEFEEGRRIAWQSRAPGPAGKLAGGRIWRYELEPDGDGTVVRESWDIRQEGAISKPGVRRMAAMTRRNMEKTLERIESIVTR